MCLPLEAFTQELFKLAWWCQWCPTGSAARNSSQQKLPLYSPLYSSNILINAIPSSSKSKKKGNIIFLICQNKGECKEIAGNPNNAGFYAPYHDLKKEVINKPECYKKNARSQEPAPVGNARLDPAEIT